MMDALRVPLKMIQERIGHPPRNYLGFIFREAGYLVRCGTAEPNRQT